ncbi:MAG: OsmC family protein [Crocinitomicaceae bacterium]|nr:OsmC family protein [Flavobacteriales bacterium]NQZ35393.1 OsmC family protein [Crocinitomicaceae bacterium]
MSENRNVTVELGSSGFKSSISVGSHVLISDEPESVGGTDLGPSPYELLASGLGACTVMTVRMYATIKKWDLKEVKVNVSHRKEDSEDGKTKIDIFSREIQFFGDFDEKQHERMLNIAKKCPVHKTLSASAKIETTHIH